MSTIIGKILNFKRKKQKKTKKNDNELVLGKWFSLALTFLYMGLVFDVFEMKKMDVKYA